jgi:hypothetical protein
MKTFDPYSGPQKLAITKDLLKKYPKGGRDREGIEFDMEWAWCDRYNKSRDLQRCNKTYWGYTEQQIHQLDFASHAHVERFILEHWYDGRYAHDLSRGETGGLSRKVNRVWDRIKRLQRSMSQGRLPGVYQIYCGGYYDSATLGFVLAQDGEVAMQLGSTLFSAWAGDRELRAKYVAFPTSENLQSKATSIQTELEEKLASEQQKHKERMARIEDEIKSYSMAMLIAMDMIESAENGR